MAFTSNNSTASRFFMNVVSVTLTAHYNYAHGTKQPRIKNSGNDSNITGALDSPMLFNNIAIKAGLVDNPSL